MDQEDSEFFISKDVFDAALRAVQGLLRQKEKGSHRSTTFTWVDDSFAEARSLHEALVEWRWKPKYDNDGNIKNIEFTGEKLGDDDVLFDALAPYVKAGSYITMRGEDGNIWRWAFKGFTCVEEYGRVVFD